MVSEIIERVIANNQSIDKALEPLDIDEVAKLCGYGQGESKYRNRWKITPSLILHSILALYLKEKYGDGPKEDFPVPPSKIIESVIANNHQRKLESGRDIGADLDIDEVAKLCGYGRGESEYAYWWRDKPLQILHRVFALYVMQKYEKENMFKLFTDSFYIRETKPGQFTLSPFEHTFDALELYSMLDYEAWLAGPDEDEGDTISDIREAVSAIQPFLQDTVIFTADREDDFFEMIDSQNKMMAETGCEPVKGTITRRWTLRPEYENARPLPYVAAHITGVAANLLQPGQWGNPSRGLTFTELYAAALSVGKGAYYPGLDKHAIMAAEGVKDPETKRPVFDYPKDDHFKIAEFFIRLAYESFDSDPHMLTLLGKDFVPYEHVTQAIRIIETANLEALFGQWGSSTALGTLISVAGG